MARGGGHGYGAPASGFRAYGSAAGYSPYEQDQKSAATQPKEFKFAFQKGSDGRDGGMGSKPMPPNQPRPPSGSRGGGGAIRRPMGQPSPPGSGARRIVEASPRPGTAGNAAPSPRGGPSPSANRAASVYLQQPKRGGSARPGSAARSGSAAVGDGTPRGGSSTSPGGYVTPRSAASPRTGYRYGGMVTPQDPTSYTPRYTSPSSRPGSSGASPRPGSSGVSPRPGSGYADAGHGYTNPYRIGMGSRPGSGGRPGSGAATARPASTYGAFSSVHTLVGKTREGHAAPSPRGGAPNSARGAGPSYGAAGTQRGAASAPTTPRDVAGAPPARASAGAAVHVGGTGVNGAMGIQVQRRARGAGAWSSTTPEPAPGAAKAGSPNFVDMWAGQSERSPGGASYRTPSPGAAGRSPGAGGRTPRGWEEAAPEEAARPPSAKQAASDASGGGSAFGRSTVTTVPEDAAVAGESEAEEVAPGAKAAYAAAQRRVATGYAAARPGTGAATARPGSGARAPADAPFVETSSRRPDSAHGALPGYTVGRVIGEGGFCKVRLGQHHMSGKKVAVKVIDKTKLVEVNDRRRVGREIRVLKRLVHENIIRCFEVVDSPSKVFVVMEHADGGSLLDYVRARKRLDEPEAAVFFHQIIAGLAYCHRHMVVHRDIKLENLLLDSNRHMKLIDFGLSAIITPGKKLRVHCGSPSYAAPEIVSRKLYDGPPVDVWSLGVVLFAMVSGYLPFHAGGNKHELCHKIIRGSYTAPDYISADVRDLLRRMLTVDPNQRITIDQLFQHRWVRSGPAYATPERAVFVKMDRHSGLSTADPEVVDHMINVNGHWDRDEIVQDLINGEHNLITASYYLLLETKCVAERRAATSAAEQAAAKGLPYQEDPGNLRYPSHGEPAPLKSPEARGPGGSGGGAGGGEGRPESAPHSRPKAVTFGAGGKGPPPAGAAGAVTWRGDSAASVTDRGAGSAEGAPGARVAREAFGDRGAVVAGA